MLDLYSLIFLVKSLIKLDFPMISGRILISY